MLKEKKMASNKQKMEQLFEAAQSVVSENRFQDALPRKVQKRNKIIELLDAIEAELESHGDNPDPRAVQMRNKLLAKLDKMGVGEKELRSIRGTRAAIDGMQGQEEALNFDDLFKGAPDGSEGDEEELERQRAAGTPETAIDLRPARLSRAMANLSKKK